MQLCPGLMFGRTSSEFLLCVYCETVLSKIYAQTAGKATAYRIKAKKPPKASRM